MALTEKQIKTLKRNNEESNKITKDAIQGALYILMEKKDYDDITITDVIRKSGVSRSALYRNYKTKEDIILDILNEFMDSFELTHSSSLKTNWQFAFQYFYENKKSLDLIIKAKLEHLLLAKLNERLQYAWHKNDVVEAMNYGLTYNTIIYWAKCGMPKSPADSAADIITAYKQMISDVERQY